MQNLPGFTGPSGAVTAAAWVTESFDLSAYAGQTVLLAFRYITDSSVDLPGWWIDNVEVGGEQVTDGTTLNGWGTPTQILPIRVAGFTVQLVAYTTAGPRKARAPPPSPRPPPWLAERAPDQAHLREHELRRGRRDRHLRRPRRVLAPVRAVRLVRNPGRDAAGRIAIDRLAR